MYKQVARCQGDFPSNVFQLVIDADSSSDNLRDRRPPATYCSTHRDFSSNGVSPVVTQVRSSYRANGQRDLPSQADNNGKLLVSQCANWVRSTAPSLQVRVFYGPPRDDSCRFFGQFIEALPNSSDDDVMQQDRTTRLQISR